MTSALDKSLDDLIKTNKKSKSGSRGGGGGAGRRLGPAPSRRFKNRGAARAAPYAQPLQAQAPDSAWQHDMFTDHGGAAAFPARAGRAPSIETGTKLLISNLDYGVSNEDIKELFSEVGDIKRYTVHYDRSGRSKGTAEVVFSRRSDAVAAVKRYNNVQLDGKPMKVDFAGTNIAAPAAVPPASSAMYARPNAPFRSQRRGSAIGRPRGGGRGARPGRGRGRGQGEKVKVSAEDLDADLDKYHSEAMQIN